MDPHAEGADAYIAGIDITSNPYDVHTQFEAHCAWNDGWEEVANLDHAAALDAIDRDA